LQAVVRGPKSLKASQEPRSGSDEKAYKKLDKWWVVKCAGSNRAA